MQDIIQNDKRRKLDRPVTGVIWKDRIWEQWYDEEALEQKLPKMNQKDFLFSCIGDDPDRVIINNRGKKKYTVKQFHDMVDTYTKAFSALNFSEGDVVCTISLTTPELYAIKYSATAIGLITCNLNVFDAGIEDDGVNRLIRQIRNVRPKAIFVLDILEDKVADILNSDEFANITKIILPLGESMPKISAEQLGIALLELKNKLRHKRINNGISLKRFLKKANGIDKVPQSVYRPGMPCNIAFTSGTTGINKAVLLSHDANNALAFQQMIGSFEWEKGFVSLVVIPPFLAFWDADIVHAVLCQGGENIIEIELTYEKIPMYFKKYRPHASVLSQHFWSSLLTLPDSILEQIGEDLKFAIVGGERCELNAAEKFYRNTGIMQMAGYGASEINTTFSITNPRCTKMGSSGLPLPFNNVKIIDEDGNDLTYGQRGRLLITGPCLMKGYLGRDDLTKKALIKDENGTTWYDTHDYAVIDEDGCLTVLDRDAPAADISCNGKTEKVKLLDVAEVINKNRNVKICKIEAIDGKIVLYLSLDDYFGLSEDEALQSVLETVKTELPISHQPDIICNMPSLPRTQVGKVDYTRLSQIGRELCQKYRDPEKLFVIRKCEE